MKLTKSFIRLDFDEFTLTGPETGTATSGVCSTDYFQATNAATGSKIKILSSS